MSTNLIHMKPEMRPVKKSLNLPLLFGTLCVGSFSLTVLGYYVFQNSGLYSGLENQDQNLKVLVNKTAESNQGVGNNSMPAKRKVNPQANTTQKSKETLELEEQLKIALDTLNKIDEYNKKLNSIEDELSGKKSTSTESALPVSSNEPEVLQDNSIESRIAYFQSNGVLFPEGEYNSAFESTTAYLKPETLQGRVNGRDYRYPVKAQYAVGADQKRILDAIKAKQEKDDKTEKDKLAAKAKEQVVAEEKDPNEGLYFKTPFGEYVKLSDATQQEGTGTIPIPPSAKGKRKLTFYGKPSLPRSDRLKEKVSEQNPLTPEDILYIKQRNRENDLAADSTATVETRKRQIQYNNDETPEIYVAKEWTSNLVFRDRVGNPIPVFANNPPNSGHFTSTLLGSDDDPKSRNVVQLTGKRIAGVKNLTVLLAGRDEPLDFKIISSDQINDTIVRVNLDTLGPNSQNVSNITVSKSTKICSTDLINNMAQGIIPPTLKRLVLDIPDMQIYSSKKANYIRSKYTIGGVNCECLQYSGTEQNICAINPNIGNFSYVDSDNEIKYIDVTDQL